MLDIINCTPHKLVIYESTDVPPMLSIEPSGIEARLSVTTEQIGYIYGGEGIPVYRTVYGEPSKLPEQEYGTIYVTSMLYAQNCDRQDVYYPGQAVRDADGNIIGCIGLTHP